MEEAAKDFDAVIYFCRKLQTWDIPRNQSKRQLLWSLFLTFPWTRITLRHRLLQALEDIKFLKGTLAAVERALDFPFATRGEIKLLEIARAFSKRTL